MRNLASKKITLYHSSCREFAKEKERVESKAGYMQLKEREKLEKEMNGYVAWICRAEDLVLAEERTSEADRIKIMEARERQKEKIKKLTGMKKNDSVETNSDDGKGHRTIDRSIDYNGNRARRVCSADPH